MLKQSAGLLVYKVDNGQVRVLLGHTGGPFYAKKDAGAWDIPKGEYEDEDALKAARREFEEELGQPAPLGEAHALGEVKAANKVVKVWAIQGDLDVSRIEPDMFTLEWPPKSGNMQKFPEIDRAEWFDLPAAMRKVVKSRQAFIERLADFLKPRIPSISLESANPETDEPKQASLF